MQIIEVYSLGQIIQFLSSNSSLTVDDAYLYAMGLSIATILHGLLHHIAFFINHRLGHISRATTMSFLYEKALRLSKQSMATVSTGKITNIISSDVERFAIAGAFFPFFIISPLHAAVSTILMWQIIGPYSLCGLALIVLIIPVHMIASKATGRLRRETSQKTDRRVKIMNELLNGVRVVKMYAWEKSFAKVIGAIRSQEITLLRHSNYIKGSSRSFYFVASALTTLVTFIPYQLSGHDLNAYNVFTCLAYFNSVQLNMTLLLPNAIHSSVELLVALKRIEEFLRLPEQSAQDSPSDSSHPQGPDSQVALSLDSVTCAWIENKPVLQNVTLKIPRSTLTCVAGPVGSGKTTLLMALLGEILPSQGTTSVQGTVAYASQEAWILSESIKDNILFGETFDEEWYHKVLDACALNADISRMPAGDETEIGERGVTLSGGQRARLSLARAVYSNRDIIIMDDPLSAVDTRVGKHIFENCICGLLKEKTRVLVTHQVQYLPLVDQILLLGKDGTVHGLGTYSELVQSKALVISDFAREDETEEEEEPKKVTDDKLNNRRESDGSLFKQEMRQTGVVKLSTYKKYWAANRGWTPLINVALFVTLAQGVAIVTDWFLSYWVQQNPLTRDNHINALIFGLLVAALTVVAFVRSIMFFNSTVQSSQYLHDSMFAAVLKTPMLFFDTNPVGRILNRFSKDIGLIDDNMPIAYFDFAQCMMAIIGVVIFVSIINPWIFLLTAPMIVVFIWLRWYYMTAGRDVKRLEASARSPIYSHLGTSLSGLTTIRCHQAGERFVSIMHQHLDYHSKGFYMFMTANRWLGVRLDLMSGIFVLVTSFASIAARSSLQAGAVGLSLAYALQLTGQFQWAVRQSAEVESQMVSVERLIEYSKLDSEEASDNSDSDGMKRRKRTKSNNSDKMEITAVKPPAGWPSQGAFEFQNVSMRYSMDTPSVLRGISFTVRAREKIGVVGRTGAGKSSLLYVLFRLSKHIVGEVLIDGVPTSSLELEVLRSHISVIPQDPTLFSGTVRYNLDPFGEYADVDIWRALEDVQLKSVIEDMSGKLDGIVEEHGHNFSVGQRQLICLARAALRKNRILVLDEATANVDNHTDALIQAAIRKNSVNCTVFTIAHRLHTVVDSDRILVLDEGRIVEFDTPHALLQNSSSYFSQLVVETTPAEQRHLREIARMRFQDQGDVSIVSPTPTTAEDEDWRGPIISSLWEAEV